MYVSICAHWQPENMRVTRFQVSATARIPSWAHPWDREFTEIPTMVTKMILYIKTEHVMILACPEHAAIIII